MKYNSSTYRKGNVIVICIVVFALLLSLVFIFPRTIGNTTQLSHTANGIDADGNILAGEGGAHDVSAASATSSVQDGRMVSHVTIPKSVKGVYMSSWVAGTPSIRSKIVKQIKETEANAVIIDIKDYTGMISFTPESAHLQQVGCIENRIKDISSFIKELHDQNIYVIGRVAVFQDPCAVQKMPEDAVKTKDGSRIWKDRNGISWMDAGSKKVWDYNIEIARVAHEMGFDEINFDYIRYPSDGNMADISFPVSGNAQKSEVLRTFFQYIDAELRGGKATGVSLVSATSTRYTEAQDPVFDELVREHGLAIDPAAAAQADSSLDGKRVETSIAQMPRMIISADLFGMVTNNTDDLGIGQVLEKLAPYVDFIGPMVYPSHYPPNFIGIKNPAAAPHAIITHALKGGVSKLRAVGLNPLKLRPWLQDFNLGATYTAEMVREQIRATYEVGLTSWMLWDASNTYTAGGMLSI